MTEITEAEIEAVARVICLAHGFDPTTSSRTTATRPIST